MRSNDVLVYLWKRWVKAAHKDSELYYFEGYVEYCRILGMEWVVTHYMLSDGYSY